MDILLISLIESVPEQRHHCHADSFIVGSIILQLLCLATILPCNDGNYQNTHLLNPVFLYCLPNQFPVQRHSFFHILYSNPAAPAVVIRNALNPCPSVAIPHCALHPGTVVAVPDRRLHVRHRHGDAGYAGIVAGIPAGRRCFSIVDNQHRISRYQIGFLCFIKGCIARLGQCVRRSIAIELTRQRSQRAANLSGSFDIRLE